jgi:hypothetical protein
MFSTNEISITKDAIATRMIRNAARNWGLQETNMDSFDPLVKMLIEACAVEFYRVDNELLNLQKNMTERLAGLLIPEVYLEPRPAHAILHATSFDSSIDVTLESQFLFQKKIASIPNGPLDKVIDVFFSPAGRYKAVSSDVKYIGNNKMVSKVEKLQKQNFISAKYNNPFEPNIVWVGIGVNKKEIIDLANVSLFFDFKNQEDKSQLFSALKHVKCFIDNTEIKMMHGLDENIEQSNANHFEANFEELYINVRAEKEVREIYNDQFLRFPNTEWFANIAKTNLSKYPKTFENYIDQSELSNFEEEVLWVQIVFPPLRDYLILDEIVVALNCFPVMNRQLNQLNYRLNNYFNIIPLLSNDQFFSIHQVDGSLVDNNNSQKYVYYPFERYLDGKKGTYTVRNNNLQRFDERNAKEFLEYLVELLRDESRAFAAFGQDFITNSIKNLNQNIELIVNKLNQNANLLTTSPTYLLINPIDDGDVILVNFWSSTGELGNNIRTGSELILYEGSNFKKEGLQLMTQSSGGRDKLKNTEILTSFKSVLLSHNRIVTAMDIKNFCMQYLQGKAKEIKVEKGVSVSRLPNMGLIPVVNVKIIPYPNNTYSDLEWDNIKTEILNLLEEKSAVDLNYNIVLN